jgi:cell volume regulation protein A
LDLSWPLTLLLGAIVGSTDAAAVFSLLKSSGVKLNERVAAKLEIESGMNDPMAVYLALVFIGVALAATAAPAAGAGLDAMQLLRSLLLQFGWGAALGVASGFALAGLLKRLGRGEGGGIRALLVV